MCMRSDSTDVPTIYWRENGSSLDGALYLDFITQRSYWPTPTKVEKGCFPIVFLTVVRRPNCKTGRTGQHLHVHNPMDYLAYIRLLHYLFELALEICPHGVVVLNASLESKTGQCVRVYAITDSPYNTG